MSWGLNVGGEVATQEDERAVIDALSAAIEALGDKVSYHSWITNFHGAGDTANLMKNVAPAPDPADSVVAADPVAPPQVTAPDIVTAAAQAGDVPSADPVIPDVPAPPVQ